MGWVHIHIMHGPGHQSKTDYYKHFYPSKHHTIKDQVEEYADHMASINYMDWPIMTWKLIRKLPASIHKDRMEDLQWMIESAKAYLALLEKTPILTVDPIIKAREIQKRKSDRMMKKIQKKNRERANA